MSVADPDLAPGSCVPATARERDLLLRRVPELAFLPELSDLRFEKAEPPSDGDHARRIAELAAGSYLARLDAALARLAARAEAESNGGLGFLAASLRHFVSSLPPAHHPLVVALYFRSLSAGDSARDRPDVLAIQMDEYESGLGSP